MKHLKHLFTALLMLCATAVAAHDFEVGGIYYKILSEEDKTIEVTSGTNRYTGSVVIPETVTVSEKTFDAWTSTNKSNNTTSQTSYTLNVEAGNILKFDWSVSSESNYDWLIITLDGTEIVKKSGTLSGSYEKTFDTAGSHTLVVEYTKDVSTNGGNDEGKIYNITLSSVGSVNDVVYQVTGIGDYAFFNCIDLTSIKIPSSVTSIGNSAFYNCTSLKFVYNNSSLDITVGSSKHGYLGTYAAVVVNKNDILEKVGNFTFHKTDSITLVDYTGVDNVISLPASYNGENYAIGKKLFSKKSNIASVIIPNSVTSIGDEAFSGCSGLTSITIPNSVTSIGYRAFSGCTGLTSVEIPNSVTSIGYEAFSSCTGLTSITIPNSVTSIGYEAFSGCYGIKSLTLGNGVKYYGTAFPISPEYIYINDLAAFCESDFYSENYLLSNASLYLNGELITDLIIPDGVTRIGEGVFKESRFTSIEIPNSVTSIGNYAFQNCYWLTSITIPNSVTSIGYEAFNYCTGLTSITSLIPAEDLSSIIKVGSVFNPEDVFSGVDKTSCTLYVPYGAKETYASTAGWKEFTNIVELEPTATEVTVTIGQYGNATYCSPYALDFSNVEGLKAYAATGYNRQTQVVTLTRVLTAQESTGLFLTGEPGEYTIPVIENSNDYTLNLLVGTLEQTTVNSTDGAMSNYKFTIAEGDAAPMFYPFEDNTAFSAGKAYLQIPTAWLPATAQKSLSVRFDDGETTDIDEVKGENGKVKGVCYDLQGRVVENPTSGIYIINGKKVVIK